MSIRKWIFLALLLTTFSIGIISANQSQPKSIQAETSQSSLVEVGRIDGPAVGLTLQDNFAYVATGRYGNNDIRIIDISDPTIPQVVGSWQCPNNIWTCNLGDSGDALWYIEVAGSYVFVRGWHGLYLK